MQLQQSADESIRSGLPEGLTAVKVLKQSGCSTYRRELRSMFLLRHANLVRLLGFCNQDTGQAFRALVYEYMGKKSLDIYIFGDKVQRATLGWLRRLNIIYEIAEGMKYMHVGSGVQMIHRDLKPHNILLDDNWTPKISDFGLAMLFSPDEAKQHTQLIALQGYTAPECFSSSDVTPKSDVYSFGVVLLEIITGRQNEISQRLLPHVWNFWDNHRSHCPNHGPGCTLELLDRDVPRPDEESLRRLQICVTVGLLCVQDSRDDRPDMPAVVDMLKSQDLPRINPSRQTLHGMEVGESSGTTATEDLP
uniref:non-specific serine/threonine protein kinase n=1 Tax=Oryza glumipatula TaxID=40148 RepID=A0A0E0BR05_9ORYZ